MNLERFVLGKGQSNKYNGKEYLVGIMNIPPSELESFEKASAYAHASLMLSDTSAYERKINEHLKKKNYSEIRKISPEEKEKRIQLRNKAIDFLLTITIDKARYKKHLTEDTHGLRYTKYEFMHRTPDMEADKKYNQRITDLLDMAATQKYADDKVLDENAQNEKNEFLGHFRTMLNAVKQYDFEELTSKEWTDEELVEHTSEIYNLNLLFTNFDDVPRDLARFGIKDQECNNIINDYKHYGGFINNLYTRLGCIVSPTYDIYDPAKEPDLLKEYDESNEDFVNDQVSDGLNSYRIYQADARQQLSDVVKRLFSELGVSGDKVAAFNPDEPEKKAISIEQSSKVMNKKGEVTYYCEDPKIRLTLNIFDDKLSKAMAQNRLSEVLRSSMVEKPELLSKPAEVVEPKKVGLLGQFADWVTSRFTGHKPRQEAYDRAMIKYNNYQTELGKYKDCVKAYDKYSENATIEQLSNILEVKEAAAKEILRRDKAAREIKSHELGFVDQLDEFKPQIKNDAKVKDLMQKELSGSYQPQIEENKPEILGNIPEKEKNISVPENQIPNV